MLAHKMSAENNIASYAVDLITTLGSETVFSVVGGMAMHLNRAVAAHPTLNPVYCQHEQAAVAAAEGYAKASDFRKAGFAVVTAGPGVSNSVTSLISAYGDSTPLIVLAGQIKSADIDTQGTRTHGTQEIRSEQIISPCVKRFARLPADDFRKVLVETIAEAFAGRPGPVFIEIPLEIQGMGFPYTREEIAEDIKKIRRRAAAADSELCSAGKLQSALSELLTAKRPLLYIGNGCRIAGVESAAHHFVTLHKIPAVFSWLSFDIFSANDPLHLGCPGGMAPISSNEVLSAADVIVFLGARLDLGTTAFQPDAFGNQAERIIVDVDRSELAKFGRFPKTRCIQASLRSLPDALPIAASQADSSWLPWCQQRREDYLKEEASKLASDANMNVYGIAKRLSTWSEDKVFVPASSGYAEETFSRFFCPAKGCRFFNGAALGSMGLGLPHAIGASFGSSRRVACLEADGGIMFNLQELATVVHYAPRGFVLFLLNNNGYESIRASQTRHFGNVTGVDAESGVYIPSFDKIADAFGLRYACAKTLSELDVILPTLGANDSPILIDMKIEKFENRGPSVRTTIDASGMPHTTPLSEISW